MNLAKVTIVGLSICLNGLIGLDPPQVHAQDWDRLRMYDIEAKIDDIDRTMRRIEWDLWSQQMRQMDGIGRSLQRMKTEEGIITKKAWTDFEAEIRQGNKRLDYLREWLKMSPEEREAIFKKARRR